MIAPTFSYAVENMTLNFCFFFWFFIFVPNLVSRCYIRALWNQFIFYEPKSRCKAWVFGRVTYTEGVLEKGMVMLLVRYFDIINILSCSS